MKKINMFLVFLIGTLLGAMAMDVLIADPKNDIISDTYPKDIYREQRVEIEKFRLVTRDLLDWSKVLQDRLYGDGVKCIPLDVSIRVGERLLEGSMISPISDLYIEVRRDAWIQVESLREI